MGERRENKGSLVLILPPAPVSCGAALAPTARPLQLTSLAVEPAALLLEIQDCTETAAVRVAVTETATIEVVRSDSNGGSGADSSAGQATRDDAALQRMKRVLNATYSLPMGVAAYVDGNIVERLQAKRRMSNNRESGSPAKR